MTLPSEAEMKEGHFAFSINNCDSDDDGDVQYFNDDDLDRNASIEIWINEYGYAFGKDFAVKAGGDTLEPDSINMAQGQAYYRLDPELNGKTITVEGIVPLIPVYGSDDWKNNPYQVLVIGNTYA